MAVKCEEYDEVQKDEVTGAKVHNWAKRDGTSHGKKTKPDPDPVVSAPSSEDAPVVYIDDLTITEF